MAQDEELEFVVEVAREAGEVLMKYYGGELTRKIKTGPNDYATEADEAAETLILKRLRGRFPEGAVVAEESGVHGKAEHTWIVDPLDGTHHFASGSDDFAVMISRARGERVELAVIWNPARKLLAAGVRGGGAFLNGEQVTLRALPEELPLSVERDNQEQLRRVGYGVTNMGAAANTLVCLAGERRGYVSSNGYIWDFAPAALLLEEAGWKVTDFGGHPFAWRGQVEAYGKPGVVAAPEPLHGELLQALSV